MSHLCIFVSPVPASLPPNERQGELADRTWPERCVGHIDSGSTFIILGDKANHVFNRGRAEVLEHTGLAQQHMNAIPNIELSKDSFIDALWSNHSSFWTACLRMIMRSSRCMQLGTMTGTTRLFLL